MVSFTILETPRARLPVYSWAAPLEEGALAQAVNCANLDPAFHHVAVMADGHQGYGVPIGAVLALDGAVSPYAVGNDIGCGMALVPTRLPDSALLSPLPTRSGGPGPLARDELMGRVQDAIPAGHQRRRRDGAARRHADPPDVFLDAAVDALQEAARSSGVALSTSQSARPHPSRPVIRDDLVARGRLQMGTLGAGNHFVELLRDPDGRV